MPLLFLNQAEVESLLLMEEDSRSSSRPSGPLPSARPSLGIAVEDLAAGRHVYRKAVAKLEEGSS
jgi:hypothetical protein